MKNKIAFQGQPASYSHLSCTIAYPRMDPLPCPTFAEAFAAVEQGRARLAMIPIDNSIAGRVADIHRLLPESSLHIIGETFLPVHHCLLGVKGAKISDLKTVYSHVHALPQCRKLIAQLKLKPVVFEDTAGSARKVANDGDAAACAIASELAAELYGLDILKKNIEDDQGNTTRFVVLAKKAASRKRKPRRKYLTSMLFKVRNMPAALYKALGGFATNGINIVKLESYLEGSKFHSALFYCEAEAHETDKSFALALEELSFYAEQVRILGSYETHSFRAK